MKTSSRTRWAVGTAGALVIAAAIAALLINSRTPGQPAVRARQYTAHQACLLTDAHGITTPQAAAVWAGMEDASLATHAKVIYLQTAGPATVGNTIPYANTLIQRHCDMILATGDPQTAALAHIAHTAPGIRFVLLHPSTAAIEKNLTTLSPSPATRSQVAHTVEDAMRQ